MDHSIKRKVVIWLVVVISSRSVLTDNALTNNTSPAHTESALDFILLHNNDLLAHFDETSSDLAECRYQDAQKNLCFGGFARISSVVKQHRNSHKSGIGLPILFLNAGNTFSGTPWTYLFRDKITTELMNALKYDVASLGTHEFDYGVDSLVPFLNAASFPVVAANLNVSRTNPIWWTIALKRATVIDMHGIKIGVIGYLNPKVNQMITARGLNVTDEITAINNEAAELAKFGVKIFIALGDSGYQRDQEIAKNCPLIDIVVGGYSQTFLYNGTPPTPDKVDGPYPTVVVQKSGKNVPIVHAYKQSKYLGKLQLSFDKDGNLLHWSGLPILLDNKIARDPEILQLLGKYRPAIERLTIDIAGTAKVDLLRSSCAAGECILGNLIADSQVHTRALQYVGSGWTDASVAIVQSGIIYDSALASGISRYELISILPFDNKLLVVNIPGQILKLALEKSVEHLPTTEYLNEFLQLSGLRVVYKIQKKKGERVDSVEVLCSNCSTPVYEKLNLTQNYSVILDAFTYNEGNNYTMFKPFQAMPMNITALDAMYNYMQRLLVVYPAIEGRSTFVDDHHKKKSKASLTDAHFITMATVTSLLLCASYYPSIDNLF